jgi:cysteine desulfurase/selenocysteine lyase
LDNAASTQKPQYVIDGVSEFVAHDYANIHRGLYSLSEKSETAYHHSKELVGELLNCKASEIIYSYNSTYAINLIAQSLVISDIIRS